MTLIQINATYGKGSTGRIVKDIHEQALAKGITSYVACASGEPSDNIYVIGGTFDHKLHALLCRINGKQAYFSKRETKKLLRFMDTISPDIVHIHNLHSNYINLNMLLEYVAEKGISLVITMHDCWYFTGKCFHYTEAKCYRWKEGCGECPKKNSDTPAWFFDKTADVFNDKKTRFEKIKNLYVVGASKWVADETSKSLLDCAKISYCYNGVNLDIFKPLDDDFRKEYGISQDDFVMLGMAPKWEKSGNKASVEAVCSLLDEHTKLVLIGGEGNDLFPENVIKVPVVKGAENMAKWYCTADVFVNLTLEDTLPFVNIEAIACGVPVITHRCSGATETIDQETGIAVTPGNIEELISAISEVKAKGKAHYKNNCTKRAREYFNVERAYDKYFEIYEEIGYGCKENIDSCRN